MSLPTAYRVQTCKNGVRRVTSASVWFFNKEDALEKKRTLEESDPEHRFIIEESSVSKYRIRWTDHRGHQSGEQIFLLPVRDIALSSRSSVGLFLGHSEFKIQSSYLITETGV